MTPPPALSVVVAASGAPEDLVQTLASLAAQAGAGRFEVVVEGGAAHEVPLLRRRGLDRARGAVVVWTEDSCVFPADWARTWLATFADPRVNAACGRVAPLLGDRAVDWAVYFCEYAGFDTATLRTTAPPRLAGNHFAVRKPLARAFNPAGIDEADVLLTLQRANVQRIACSDALALHARRYSAREALTDRLHFGFGYGRRRCGALRPSRRALALAVGPPVLLVQTARLLKTVLTHRRRLGPFAESLPITLALLAAWSVGEWLGWLSALALPRPSRK